MLAGAKHQRSRSMNGEPSAFGNESRELRLLRERNPTFAISCGKRKPFLQAGAELRAYPSAYRQSFRPWCAGVRSVVGLAERLGR